MVIIISYRGRTDLPRALAFIRLSGCYNPNLPTVDTLCVTIIRLFVLISH